jgi:hypothetical protein
LLRAPQAGYLQANRALKLEAKKKMRRVLPRPRRITFRAPKHYLEKPNVDPEHADETQQDACKKEVGCDDFHPDTVTE